MSKYTVVFAALVAVAMFTATSESADAKGFHFAGGGVAVTVGHSNHFVQPIYGGHGCNYGGGWGWNGGHSWHNTSHWDWHPTEYTWHGNHWDVQPGHWDYHQDGHWDHHHP